MLIYLGPNPYFPEGTLFDLDDQPQLALPDRGDGTSATIDRQGSIICPPFAENIPPGQCPVVVTSYAIGERAEDIASITVDESIHFQVLVIPQSVESILVNDRVRSVEVDSYFPSANGDETEYRFHIGHLRPGFFEAMITFADRSTGRLTFIKFFPPRFSAAYPGIRNDERPIAPREEVKMISVTAYEPDHEAELLNKALELATEWGENFRKPIHDRIRVFHPELDDPEIDRLTTLANEAESYIYQLGERELAGEIREADIPNLARERYPWLSKNNVNRLTGISMFYARK
ncbi:MAG TPA: hypothetical protein PLP21_11565 [Pyrinomonadaceae bacterium]|nr:hypothetical protein [Pyrinomonadaceae bacterium]